MTDTLRSCDLTGWCSLPRETSQCKLSRCFHGRGLRFQHWYESRHPGLQRRETWAPSCNHSKGWGNPPTVLL
jgi:hypothetical protein